MTTVRGVLAFALAVSLAACGEADDAPAPELGPLPEYSIAGCEELDHTSCDVREASCQERLLALTACIREDEVPPMPPVTVMSEAEFGDYLRESNDDEPEPEVNHLERALVGLDLVEVGALGRETVIADLVEKIGGVYRHDTDDVLIVDHGQSSDLDMSSSVLVHEFVHYLQDRQVDLDAFNDAHSPTSDAALAADALVEGEAELHQLRYYASALGLNPNIVNYPERFETMMAWSETYLLGEASPFTQIRSVFPYAWGGRYAAISWAFGGPDTLAQRFESPPTQTLTLMAAANGTIPDEVEAVALASPTAPEGWSLYSDDVGGAFLQFLYLMTRTTVGEARELSLAWRGDRLSIYAQEEPASDTAWVWRFAFENQTARDRMGTLTSGIFGRILVGDTELVLVGSYSGETVVDWAVPL